MPKVTSYEPGTPCWVDLASPEPRAASSFYGGLFGWQSHTSPDPAAGGYTMFTLGGLEGHEVAAVMPLMNEGQPVAWTVYVCVEDAEATARRVTEAGGRLLLQPMDAPGGQGRLAVFADDQGAVIGLWQPGKFPGAGIVNDVGSFCWSELACRDVERAKSFYGTVFGWSGMTNSFGPTSYTEWQVGGRTVGGMMEMNDQWPPDVPPHWMVCFTVEDCDRSAALAGELGGTISVPPSDLTIGRFAVVGDPHGAWFSIMQFASSGGPEGR